MDLVSLHSQTGLDLPLNTETGAVILGIGFVVLVVITYDIYMQHWNEG